MGWKKSFQLLLTAVLFVRISEGQNATYVCKETSVPGSEFEFNFKYFRDGNTLATGLTSYDASENPDFVTDFGDDLCITSVIENDIFTLGFPVDVDAALPCGISQDTVTPSLYKFAIAVDGTATVYTFECDTTSLQLPNTVTVETFATQHLQASMNFTSDEVPDVKFEVLLPDDRPAKEVLVGQYLKLRLTYDSSGQYFPNSELPDNLGMVFHTAIPSPTNELSVQLYTLSESWTTVHITGQYASVAIDKTVQTRKSNPTTVSFTVNYNPAATSTNWDIVDVGLKIQSFGEEIGVILDRDGLSSFVVHPDEVLGTDYRPLSVMDSNRVLVIATSDDTDVSFDLSNYPKAGLQISGSDVSSADLASFSINEGQAIEILCVEKCAGLPISSSKRVAIVLSMIHPTFRGVIQVPAKNKLYRDFILYKSNSQGRPREVTIATAGVSDVAQYTQNGTMSVLNGTEQFNTFTGTQLSATDPILAVYTAFGIGATALSMMVVPAIVQWSSQYHFYLRQSTFYTFMLVTTVPNLAQIDMITPSSTIRLGDMTTFVANQVDAAFGGLYEQFAFYIVIDETEYVEGWYEFSSSATNVPFGMYAVAGQGNPHPIMPFGMTFPCLNESTGEVISCDMSDTASGGSSGVLTSGIRVDDLIISDTSTFSGPNVQILHQNGCNINAEDSAFSTVKPFTRNADIADRWVMDTLPFRAFRFKTSSALYLRVIYDICFAHLENCVQSCIARRKRSTRSHHVDIKINVLERISTGESEELCDGTTIYWMPHILLLLIISIEVVTTLYFLLKKWKLKV